MFRTTSFKSHGFSRTTSQTSRPLSTSKSCPKEKVKNYLKCISGKPDVLQSLKQLRHDMHDELVDWSGKQAQKGLNSCGESHTSPELREAAAAHSLAYALRAVCDMTKNYELKLAARMPGKQSDARQVDSEFLAHIRPEHMKRLRSDFSRTWSNNSLERRAAIFSAVAPGVMERLDVAAKAEERELAMSWGSIPEHMQLLASELLALVDYVNSSTGTFNAVNSAAVAHAFYGEPLFMQLVAGFNAALDSAIEKLCKHPYFGLKNIVTYKGIRLENAAGPFRMAMLKDAIGTGRIIAFPNVLSTTRNEYASYASTKFSGGYSTELQITMRRGVDADPFHDDTTMGEMEVLGPRGQKFIVTEKTETFINDLETGSSGIRVDRYILFPKD